MKNSEEVELCPFCNKIPDCYIVGERKHYPFPESGTRYVKCINTECAIWNHAVMQRHWQTRTPQPPKECEHKWINAQDNNCEAYKLCVKCGNEVILPQPPKDKEIVYETFGKIIKEPNGKEIIDLAFKGEPIHICGQKYVLESNKPKYYWLVPLDFKKVCTWYREWRPKHPCESEIHMFNIICNKFGQPPLPRRVDAEEIEKIITRIISHVDHKMEIEFCPTYVMAHAIIEYLNGDKS